MYVERVGTSRLRRRRTVRPATIKITTKAKPPTTPPTTAPTFNCSLVVVTASVVEAAEVGLGVEVIVAIGFVEMPVLPVPVVVTEETETEGVARIENGPNVAVSNSAGGTGSPKMKYSELLVGGRSEIEQT